MKTSDQQQATYEQANANDPAAAETVAETTDETTANAPEYHDEEASNESRPESDPRLEAALRQAEEHYKQFLRAQADLDNFRRRTRQEKEDLLKYSSMKLIEQLLPVVDNFERAISAAKENRDLDAFAKGVDMIFRQLMQVLEQEGLKPMASVGQPFNPEFHEAVMQVESADHTEGIVVEEMQKGYMLKEKVLRPAMVKVSS